MFGHEGKCANVHGHRYSVHLTLCAPVDSLGRVIDFGEVKAVFGKWLDDHWDHALVLWDADPLAGVLEQEGQRVFRLPVNPTAENLALYLLRTAPQILTDHKVTVTKVLVQETPNCYAEAEI